MKKQNTHQSFMSYNDIVKTNVGLNVLKHFIEINFKLLPIYHSLNLKKIKTKEDLNNMFKIDCLFSSFNIDVDLSKNYLNSPILELIQLASFDIQNFDNNTSNTSLENFILEYFRLKEEWNFVLSN